MLREVDWVLKKLAWMRAEAIWPNGLRYLWTDAFGLVLYVSLYRHTNEEKYLDLARHLVAEVDRVLRRPRGYRIGEEPDRDGQYFHYLMMWTYALHRMGEVDANYDGRALKLIRDIHEPFVKPGVGVVWKMEEDLSRPYPGYGLGAIDPYHGYVVYRLVNDKALASEIAVLREMVDRDYQSLRIDQDLGLGMMLWQTHFFPHEPWAAFQRARSLADLDRLWIDPPGYFGRQAGYREMRFAFTNYGVSLGLQAVGEWPDRVKQLNAYFETYRSGDEYDQNAITHVMACTSHFPGAFIRAPSLSRRE